MKFLRIAVLVFIAFGSVTAQNFEPVGGALLVQEVQPELANECYIYFDDFSEDTLHLQWQLEEVSTPEEWDIDLCDYGVCYTGIPPAETMLPAPGWEQPYLKLVVQPGLVSGSAWLWFRVFPAGQPDLYRDVYFSLYTSGVTTVQEPGNSQFISIFPNPAADFFIVKRDNDLQTPARLLDVSGKSVWAGMLNSAQTQIFLPDLNAGIYFFETAQIRKTVIIH